MRFDPRHQWKHNGYGMSDSCIDCGDLRIIFKGRENILCQERIDRLTNRRDNTMATETYNDVSVERVTVKMPIPAGFTPVEFRHPLEGEYFLNNMGFPTKRGRTTDVTGMRMILKKRAPKDLTLTLPYATIERIAAAANSYNRDIQKAIVAAREAVKDYQ